MKHMISNEELNRSKQQIYIKWTFFLKCSVDSRTLLFLWYNLLFVISIKCWYAQCEEEDCKWLGIRNRNDHNPNKCQINEYKCYIMQVYFCLELIGFHLYIKKNVTIIFNNSGNTCQWLQLWPIIEGMQYQCW